MFAVMSWGGLRVGEALALTPEKVDLDRRAILVNAQLGGSTKTEGERSVDMAAPLAAALGDALARRAAPARRRVVAFAAGAAEHVAGQAEAGPWLFYRSWP
jgi:integrase